MAIEDLRVIGDVMYERRADGMLYPVRRVAPAGLLASQPEDQGSATGIPELDRMLTGLGNINQMLNPVEGIGQSMDASRRMLAPDTAGWDRVAALGDMLSGVAGVAAPVAAAARAGTPAAMALMEGLLGWSPTSAAAKDTAKSIARTVAERANQRGPVPTMGSNLGNLLGDVGEASTGIRAYHTTEQPFEAYDWSRLGVNTGYQTSGISGVEDWAANLAKIGPWAHEAPLSSKMGGYDLPIDISGKGKKFKSLDALERSVVKAGGPEQFRNKLVSEGFGHIRVADEEFKGTSFVGLSPESFVVNAPREGQPPQGLLGDTLPAPRNEAEAIAKNILELRATGNVDAVTEGMMNAADPQYMYNYTPLPMDEASRMARAGDIGFPKEDWYHGTNQDIGGFQGNVFTADNPTLASTYARGITDAQTYPLLLRSKLSTTPVDVGGRLWSQIPIQAIDDPAVASWLDPNALQSTRSIEAAAVKEGRSGVRFKDVLDIGPGFDSQQFKRAGYSPAEIEAMRLDYLRQLDTPATVDVRLAPNQVRSRFARFDPMFSHLRNLSAGVAISPLAYGLLSDQYARENRQ